MGQNSYIFYALCDFAGQNEIAKEGACLKRQFNTNRRKN
jgi:hypothetical protein